MSQNNSETHEVVGNTVPPPREGEDQCASPEPSEPLSAPPALKRRRIGAAPARSRDWCFTLNNPSPVEADALRKLGEKNENVKYMVLGKEVGKEGTPHLQGFCQFVAPITMKGAKDRLGPRCHVEARRGAPSQASEYCKKGGDYVEYGALSGQGQRTDLIALQETLDSDVPMSEVVQRHFGAYMRYSRAVTTYRSLSRATTSRPPPKIRWLWGPSGVGKTRSLSTWLTSMELTVSDDCYFLSTTPTGTWWDGYEGQKVVVLDDFRGTWFPHHVALRIFDRLPYKVPAHGQQLPLVSEYFFVTTNMPPTQTYAQDPAGAFMRRVDDYGEVIEMKFGASYRGSAGLGQCQSHKYRCRTFHSCVDLPHGMQPTAVALLRSGLRLIPPPSGGTPPAAAFTPAVGDCRGLQAGGR